MRSVSAALGLAVLVLTGCQTDEQVERPCPDVETVPGAERLTRFDTTGTDLTDVLFEAEIGDARGTCAYDEGVLDLEMDVEIAGSRGPADLQRRGDLGFFVAVADAERKVLAREAFGATVEFPGNQTRSVAVEEIELAVPTGGAVEPLTIFVGFQLTPDELEYNRRSRR